MFKCNSYAATSATADLAKFEIERREPNDNEVLIKILYCGVCHSDIHLVRNEFYSTIYPIVPGHEIAGVIEKVGGNVKKFQINDKAAVGCFVGSCRECEYCKDNREQFCTSHATFTFNSKLQDGTVTYGGYSKYITVNEHFALKVPDSLSLAGAAPLLCAGITSFSPLHRWNVHTGQKVGIVGLGGLGHMGVKFAVAMGARVTVISTSESKRQDAANLGAHEFIVSKDEEKLNSQLNTFDLILDTVSADHEILPLVNLLRTDGKYVLVGAILKPLGLSVLPLIMKNIIITGSACGGLQETQKMLDYCGQHNITSDIEIISIDKINEAYNRVLKSDVKYRFVIDMSTLD